MPGSTHVEQQNEQQYEACTGSVLWYAVQAKELLATAEHKVEGLEEQGEGEAASGGSAGAVG